MLNSISSEWKDCSSKPLPNKLFDCRRSFQVTIELPPSTSQLSLLPLTITALATVAHHRGPPPSHIQRISAKDALNAEYFWTDPLPCDPRSLPKYESSHEFQTKKKRQQQRQNKEMAKRQKLQHPQQHANLIACFCRHDKEGNARFVVFEFVDYALHPCPVVWLRNTSFLMRATS
ncbi:unnamed protein product [Camellia sinensis]